MKKSIFLNAAIFVGLVALVSSCQCETDNPPEPEYNSHLKLVIELYNGAQPMNWDDVVAVDNVKEYRMEFFKYHLDRIKAVNNAGSEILLEDVLIADASEPDGMTFVFAAPDGGYEKLIVGVGLDEILNASDPISFAPEEPLSAAQAMYWSWAAKYRFVRIDARANKSGTIGDTSDILVAYHPGADEFHSFVEWAKPFNLMSGDTTEFKVKLDLAAFFDGPGGKIDIPSEPQSHTTPDDYDIAEKFMINFAAAFEPM